MEEFDPLDTDQQELDQAAAEAARKLAQQQEAADFLWLMEDQRGRRIVWKQLSSAGVFKTTFNPDAMTMAFSEGRRTAGLELLSIVHSLCPQLYHTMMKESL